MFTAAQPVVSAESGPQVLDTIIERVRMSSENKPIDMKVVGRMKDLSKDK